MRVPAAVAGMFAGALLTGGCEDRKSSPPPAPVQPASGSQSGPEVSPYAALITVSDQVIAALEAVPHTETDAVASVTLVSPLGKLRTPDIGGGLDAWKEVARQAAQKNINHAEFEDLLRNTFESLNQIYLYTGYYRHGHHCVVRQEELFVLDGHPRNPELLKASIAQVEKADEARLRLAEAVRLIKVVAGAMHVELIEKSPLEEKLDSIMFKPGAQKAVRELLGFAKEAEADLSPSDRIIYIDEGDLRAKVLGQVPEGAPELVAINVHSLVSVLTETSILLETARANVKNQLEELVSVGRHEAEVKSPAAQQFLKDELERANVGLNRIATLDWQIDYLTRFVEKIAGQVEAPPKRAEEGKPPRF